MSSLEGFGPFTDIPVGPQAQEGFDWLAGIPYAIAHASPYALLTPWTAVRRKMKTSILMKTRTRVLFWGGRAKRTGVSLGRPTP